MFRKQVYACAACLLIALSALAKQKPTSNDAGVSGQDANVPAPEIFAPGIISGPANDGSPTFSPDGNTLFFTRSSGHWSIILESHRVNGLWSQPKIAPFSGEWSDASPAISPDGSYLIFVSIHPLEPAAGSAAQETQAARRMGSHIWRVNREGSGWGRPFELLALVNFCPRIFRPSVAADGTIYFTAKGDQDKNLRLYRSQFVNGAYRAAEPLSFSDGSMKDVDPEIAPDQSFLIFSSNGRSDDGGAHEHLFIIHREGDAWGKAEPMHYLGDYANGSSDDNDPRLGADHKTLYFTSDRGIPVHFPRTREQASEDFQRLESWDNSNSNIWSISLASWLKT